MTRLPLALLSILGALIVPVIPAGAADPATVTREIREIGINPESAVTIEGFRLKAGLARVILNDGILVPSTPVAGRPVEFVFLGDGRIELEAPDEIEADQLELFTGSSSFVESFERAVFVIAADAASDAAGRATPKSDASRIDEAIVLFDSWRKSAERKLLDVEARVFADGVGDRLAAGFFCGYFEGLNVGHFLLVVDPVAQEQVTLGQFIQLDLSRREEKRIRRTIKDAQRKGKLIGLEVADLGTWDTWVSSSLQGGDGQATPGARGFEPSHYDIDAKLIGKELEIEATAVISSRAVVDGLAAAAFEMNPDLKPVRVVDGAGGELDWYRSNNELVVVLAEPADMGSEFEVGISYTGDIIEKVSNGAFVQRDTTGWYPHGGTIDRATYAVSLRWPEKLDLVAPGVPENLLRAEKGTKARRWRIERPSMGFSFELGKYDVAVGIAGDVSIRIAIDKIGRKADHELTQETLATVIDVMEYYTEVFGPYPLDRLQVVSSPRSFSQGLLGFVTLSTAAVVDWDIWGGILGIEDRRTVIAHELAHQWWGNLVGWRGYRDQWISEAMANYAALLWARNRVPDTGDARLGAGPIRNWQLELLRTTDDGRPIESLGPLVVGARLDSSISGSAYPAIVYKKGAVILNMLSEFFQEDTFVGILRAIVEAASDRVISTDDFLRGIAQLSGTDLTWFRRQYVYGTGLPEIYYSYHLEELDGGRWAVVGEVSQQAPYQYLYRVVETENGSFDLRRHARPQLDVTDSILVIPFQVGLAGEPEMADGRRPMLTGRVVVEGESSPFRLEFDHTPGVFWLDREEEVFGRFFNTDLWPRRTTFHQGLDLDAAGDADGARETVQRALSEEVTDVPQGWEDYFYDTDVTVEGERLDARIHLTLARLDLDAGRVDDAAIDLDRARDVIKSRDRWYLARSLLVVESRIELLSGDARAAYRRLKKGVLGKRGIDNPETWALLAIAADAAGETEVFERASTRADELGVDLGPLTRD